MDRSCLRREQPPTQEPADQAYDERHYQRRHNSLPEIHFLILVDEVTSAASLNLPQIAEQALVIVSVLCTQPQSPRQESVVLSSQSPPRSLSRREATGEEFDTWQKQMRSRTNDRGACILLSARRGSRFGEGPNELPLLSQSRATKCCSPKTARSPASAIRCLWDGPSKSTALKTFDNLDRIRHIRNAFAHAHAPVSFATKEIKDVVNELVDLEVLYPRVYRNRKVAFKRLSPRRKFEYICNAIAHNLIIHSMDPIHEVDQNALKPKSAADPRTTCSSV